MKDFITMISYLISSNLISSNLILSHPIFSQGNVLTEIEFCYPYHALNMYETKTDVSRFLFLNHDILGLLNDKSHLVIIQVSSCLPTQFQRTVESILRTNPLAVVIFQKAETHFSKGLWQYYSCAVPVRLGLRRGSFAKSDLVGGSS